MKIFRRIILLALIVITGGVVFLLNSTNKLNPVDETDTSKVIFEVVEGDTSDVVVNRLFEENLIANFNATYELALEKQLQLYPNVYEVSRSMSSGEILDIISNPKSNVVSESLLLLEGELLEKVASNLSPLIDMSKEEIINYWDDPKNIERYVDNYWFMSEELYNDDLIHPLEGYFYPATYEITENDDLDSLTMKFLDEMGRQLEKYRDMKFKNDFTIHQILTLASIVEREMVTEEDRYLGAGVFYNRIAAGDMLGSDITTLYVLGINQIEMTNEQLDNDSPYNTRKVAGLPPGPVAMPSIISIDAAINPKETNHYYFYATPEGEVLYTDSLEQHEANKVNNPW